MLARTTHTLFIASDVHFAGASERTRVNHEARVIRSAALRAAVRLYRHHVWVRDPFAHNALLDRFIDHAREAGMVVVNGDYSCDTAFVGVSDSASCESAVECLGRLRQAFPANLQLTIGDHELGKLSLFGGAGGMRMDSWRACQKVLALEPAWHRDIGLYRLVGVTSSLVALPIYEPETLPAERPDWTMLRRQHLDQIEHLFASAAPNQRFLLFCHDPSALPFLAELPAVAARLPRIQRTILGHLHSPKIFRTASVLAGLPRIRFLGATLRRISGALRQARIWPRFHPLLCPSLAGLEIDRSGGFYQATLDPSGERPVDFQFHPLPRIDFVGAAGGVKR